VARADGEVILVGGWAGIVSLNGAEAREVRILASEVASNMQVVVFPQPCHLHLLTMSTLLF
jgi:hypothetical protein